MTVSWSTIRESPVASNVAYLTTYVVDGIGLVVVSPIYIDRLEADPEQPRKLVLVTVMGDGTEVYMLHVPAGA